MRKPAPTVRDPADRFQRDTRNVVSTLSSIPLLNGVEVEADLSTDTTRVYHNLGRPARGFLVIDSVEDVRVWRDPDFAASPTLVIPLKASTTATVTLWVF